MLPPIGRAAVPSAPPKGFHLTEEVFWAERRLMRFRAPPPPLPYAATKAEKIERCRLRVLSYRIGAQSKSTLTLFPHKSTGCLNWVHRRQNLLEYGHGGAVLWSSCVLLPATPGGSLVRGTAFLV